MPTYREPFSFTAEGLSRFTMAPPHPKNQNFSVTVYVGINYRKKVHKERWFLCNNFNIYGKLNIWET
jgi:hypothetical protein